MGRVAIGRARPFGRVSWHGWPDAGVSGDLILFLLGFGALLVVLDVGLYALWLFVIEPKLDAFLDRFL